MLPISLILNKDNEKIDLNSSTPFKFKKIWQNFIGSGKIY